MLIQEYKESVFIKLSLFTEKEKNYVSRIQSTF